MELIIYSIDMCCENDLLKIYTSSIKKDRDIDYVNISWKNSHILT